MRLTKEIRNEVLDLAKTKIIKPKIDIIKKEIKEMAQIMADNFYPKKIQEWIDASPKGGLFQKSTFEIKMGEGSLEHKLLNSVIYGRSRPYDVSIKSIKVLNQDEYNEKLNPSKKQLKRLNEIIKLLNDIQEEKTVLHNTLVSALWGCNTRKQLIENYPDLEKYLPAPTKQSKVLTITNEDVKKVLAA